MKKIRLISLFALILSSCNKENPSSDFTEVSCSTSLDKETQNHPIEFLDKPYWYYLNDQTLSCLQVSLLQNNRSLKEAGEKIRVLLDEASGAKAKLFPQLSFVFQDNYQYYSRNSVFAVLTPNLPSSLHDFTTGLGFQWNFDLFSKQRYLYKALKNEAIAEIYKQKNLALELSSLLSKTYLNLKVLGQIEKILNDQISLKKDQIAINTQLLSYNLTSAFPNFTLQEELDGLTRELELLKKAQIYDQTLIHELIGQMPDSNSLTYNLELPTSLPLLSLEELDLALITQRPDIQMAVHLLNAAGNKIKSAKAAFYPNINLSALLGLDSVFFPKLFESVSQSYNVNPVLELPLFNAGLLAANLRKERHLYQALIYSYDNTLLKAAHNVVSEASKFIHHENAYQLSAHSDQLEQERLSLKIQTRQAGLIDQMELIRTQLERLTQFKKTCEDQRDYLFSFVSFSIALGGGL